MNPLEDAIDDWVIGSQRFLKKIVRLGSRGDSKSNLTRRSRAWTSQEIIEFVAAEHGVEASSYVGFRCDSPGRETAALLCRELTRTTLAQLSTEFGLRHPDSSANLVRRAKKQLNESKPFKLKVEKTKRKLLKTENQD